MTSLGLIASADKETILETIALLKQVAGLRIIFVRQSELRLFIVTEDTYNIVKDVNGEERR